MAQRNVSGTFTGNATSAALTIMRTGVVFLGSTTKNTFGSGAVQIQAKGPDNKWYAHGETVTAPGIYALAFSLPTEVRLALSGSTSPDLDYSIMSDLL